MFCFGAKKLIKKNTFKFNTMFYKDKIVNYFFFISHLKFGNI